MRLVDYADLGEAVRDTRLALEAWDTAALLSLNGELFELNMVAAIVWEQLAFPRTVQELAGQVGKHFDADADTALTDVTDLLSQLMALSLIEHSP